MKILIISIVIVLTGCAVSPSTPHPASLSESQVMEHLKPCPDEARSAALDKVYPTLSGVGSAPSEEPLAAAERSIACLRPWAEALTDHCQKEAVLNWLEFYETRIGTRRKELASGNDQTEAQRQDEEFRESQRRLHDYERKHPFPKMPQCESK